MTSPLSLSIYGLHERHPGLTKALGETFAEAASVCWSRFYGPPILITLKSDNAHEVREVRFEAPNARVQHAHGNEIDATEAGAYGVSLAALEELRGLVAVGRAETLTGADWYVAPVGSDIEDLENCIRLEVSGSSAGTENEIQKRLREKVAQAARGTSNLPAIASVVGFKAREVLVSPLGVHK